MSCLSVARELKKHLSLWHEAELVVGENVRKWPQMPKFVEEKLNAFEIFNGGCTQENVRLGDQWEHDQWGG